MGCCRLQVLLIVMLSVLYALASPQHSPRSHLRNDLPKNAPLFFRAFSVARADNQYQLYFFSDIIYDYLTFIKQPEGYQARFRMEVYLENQKTHQVYSASWKDTINVRDFSETNRRDRFFLSCDSVVVPAGKYKLTYLFRDLQVEIQFKKMFKVDLPKIKPLQPSPPLWCLPGVLRNCQSLHLPCRPRAITGDLPFNQPFQLLLMGHSARENPLQISVSVFSISSASSEKVIFQLDTTISVHRQRFKTRIPLPSLSWEEGSYRLRIHYQSGKEQTEQTADFRIVWYNRPRSLATIELALQPLQLMLSREEIKKRFSGNKEEKIHKFIAFWKEKDPTPLTAFNEALYEFYSRVDTANMEWGMPGKEGWRSDPGRIYVLYGRPDEIEDHSLDPRNRFMVWIYHTPSGTQRFIFKAVEGRRKYKLIREERENE